jgi:hypothetical protein
MLTDYKDFSHYWIAMLINGLSNKITELNVGKLTVGKIYGGLLILENWKATRFGQIEPSASMVR